MEAKEKTKKYHVGTIITLLVFIASFVTGLVEAGLAGFLTIPLFIFALLGSMLGIIPFVGPVLYYFGLGWLFDIILKSTNVSMPVASGIIFYAYLLYAILYCLVSSLVLVVLLVYRRRIKLELKRNEQRENSKNP